MFFLWTWCHNEDIMIDWETEFCLLEDGDVRIVVWNVFLNEEACVYWWSDPPNRFVPLVAWSNCIVFLENPWQYSNGMNLKISYQCYAEYLFCRHILRMVRWWYGYLLVCVNVVSLLYLLVHWVWRVGKARRINDHHLDGFWCDVCCSWMRGSRQWVCMSHSLSFSISILNTLD